MPETAPQPKIDATREYGAEVTLHGRKFQTALAHAEVLADDYRMAFVHAYDDPVVVAGQVTLGLEHAVAIKRSIRDAGFEVTQTN